MHSCTYLLCFLNCFYKWFKGFCDHCKVSGYFFSILCHECCDANYFYKHVSRHLHIFLLFLINSMHPV